MASQVNKACQLLIDLHLLTLQSTILYVCFFCVCVLDFE